MDASGKLVILHNEKGMALVYVAFLLVVLIGFAGLVIDLGYMYVSKTQLQNAADAAALAGAAKLEETSSTYQPAARQEAQKFSTSNKAAGENVTTDLNTSNQTAGDIVIGNWNGLLFTETIPTGGIANAIKVVTRRTTETGDGISSENKPIDLFLGKILGWNQMGAKSEAIATRPLKASIAISMCLGSQTLPVPENYYFKESNQPTPQQGLAFTEFSTDMSTSFGPDSDIEHYITQTAVPPDVCGQYIASNNAGPGEMMTVLNTQFNTEAASTGGYWDVIVPVVGSDAAGNAPCPPGTSSTDPHSVVGYARVRMTNVYTGSKPGIRISAYTYIPCGSALNHLGQWSALAK